MLKQPMQHNGAKRTGLSCISDAGSSTLEEGKTRKCYHNPDLFALLSKGGQLMRNNICFW